MEATLEQKWFGVKTARDEYDAAVAALNKSFTPFKKGRGWWIPDHGLGVNMTLMGGINLWRFSTYPTKVQVTGDPGKLYHAAMTDKHGNTYSEGIEYRPMWVPYRKLGESIAATPKNVEVLLEAVKSFPSVGEITKREFKLIESKAGIKIPSSIVSQCVSKAPKVAARRWGVNRLKTNPQLLPFDGGKAEKMDSYGRKPRKTAASVLEEVWFA